MANTLKASVSITTRTAEQQLEKLAKLFRSMDSGSDKLRNNLVKVDAPIQKSANDTAKWGKNQRDVNKEVDTTNKKLNKSSGLIGSISGKLKGIAATYLGIMGARSVMNTSDTITSAENKLNNLNATALGANGVNADGSYSQATLDATQQSMDKMYASANKVRMAYGDMMSNVSKSMTLAGGAFGGNIDNAIRFQEIMAESYALGGASAAEMSSSMYQMIQALGSGILQGDELRSVREGAPLAYAAIEEFAQGVYKTEESLKDLASQGKITSDIVVAAIMDSGDTMDSKFAQTKATFAQTMTVMKNTAIKAFEPVLQKLNDLLNSERGQKMIQGLTGALVGAANVIMAILNAISWFISLLVDNWSWLQYIVYAGLIILAAAMIAYWSITIYESVKAAGAWVAAHSAMFWATFKVILVIGLVVASIWWLAQNAKSGSDFILGLIAIAVVVIIASLIKIFMTAAATAAATGVAISLPFIFWALLVVGILLILVAAFIAAGQYIVGALAVAGAVIVNMFISVINAIIQFLWANFVAPVASVIEWLVNAFTGGFDGIGGAFANLLGQMLSLLLEFAKVFGGIIDIIFGSNINGTISQWQTDLRSWGKNSNAVDYHVAPPQLQRISYGDAWNAGKSVGASGQAAISQWGDGLRNKLTMGNNQDEAIRDPSEIAKEYGDLNTTPVTGGGAGGALDDIGKSGKKTADNTGKMKDSMELANEDLEYLRKIAEMEWKKEFTTANITVDMTNNNTLNGESDLDGIVTKLTEKLYEELAVVANGVYA